MMTDSQIIEQAEQLLQDIARNPMDQLVPRLRKVVYMLNQVKGKEARDLQCEGLEHLIHLGLAVGEPDLFLESLYVFRQLIRENDLAEWEGRLAQNTAQALPYLMELPGYGEDDLDQLVAEIKAKSKSDEKTERQLAVYRLEAYQVLGLPQQAANQRDHLRRSRDWVFQVECGNCQIALQAWVYVLIDDIEEAIRQTQPLMNGYHRRCLRSPRIPLAALTDYFLQQDDLATAAIYAEPLAETLDFLFDAGIKLANPLLEYLVRSEQEDNWFEALEWINFFAARMVGCPLQVQRRRFYQSAALLMQNMKRAGWTHLEARDLPFPLPLQLAPQGYGIQDVTNYFTQEAQRQFSG